MGIQNDAEEILVYSYKQKLEGKGVSEQAELEKITGWDRNKVIFAMEYLIRKGLMMGKVEGAMGHVSTAFAYFNDISPDGIDVIENQKKFEKHFEHTIDLKFYKFSWGSRER